MPLAQPNITANNHAYHIVRVWISMILVTIVLANQVVTGENTSSDYYELGVANVKTNGWIAAIFNFTEAIHSNPTNALAYDYRGGAHVMMGDPDNAIKDYTQAIHLGASNSWTFCNRAGVYRAKHEFEKAIHDYDASLQLNSTNSIAHKGRAASYSVKGEFATAIKDWNEGLRLDSNDSKALTCRAWDYSKTGQFENAVQDLKEAIRLDPKNDRAFNNLSWLRATCPVAEIRNGKEAIVLATKSCELTDWKQWDWIDTLAAAYAEAGDFKNAIKHLKQAMGMIDVNDTYYKEMQNCLLLYEQGKPYRERKAQ